MNRETLSGVLTRTLLALLPALSALALLTWYCAGTSPRLSDAAVLLLVSVLLAFAGLLHAYYGPLCLGVLSAALTVFLGDRAELIGFFRTLLNGGVPEASRVALLLCAGVVGLICLLLLRHFALRAAVSLLFTAFWIFAAFRYPDIPRLAFAAMAPLLLFTLCETISRLRGAEAETLQASFTRLLLFCALSLILLAAPSAKEPYPYPLYNAVRSRIQTLLENVETQLRYRRSGDSEFTMRFDGYTEDAAPAGEVTEEAARVILVQPGPDTGGVFYLAGSSYDSFDGARWTSTVDRELVDTLGWSADAAERLYAYWRIRQNSETPFYLGENSLYLQYRNMDVRTLFTAQNTYFIRTNTDRFPFHNQPSKVLFDYQQDLEVWYRLFLLHPYAADRDLAAAAEGYDYDEHATLQWNTVLLDFGDRYGVGTDRADKVEPFLARRESFIRRHYTTLPDGVSDELRALAERITAGCETDTEKLYAIADYLQRHYSYTRSPSPVPDGETLLDYLLFESKEGYCTWYATAAAVLGRLSGVPTRYVQGFRIELVKGKPDLISTTDSHAWCEGYVSGYGWVTIDATPGFTAELPSEDADVLHAPGDVPDATDLTVPGEKETPAPEPEIEEPQAQEGGKLLLWAACAVGLLLLAAAVMLLLRERRRRRDYAAADFAMRTTADLQTLLGYLARRGYPRAANQSLREFFSEVRWHYLVDVPSQAEDMLRLYEDVLFGGKRPTEEEWLEERQFVDQLRPRRK